MLQVATKSNDSSMAPSRVTRPVATGVIAFRCRLQAMKKSLNNHPEHDLDPWMSELTGLHAAHMASPVR